MGEELEMTGSQPQRSSSLEARVGRLERQYDGLAAIVHTMDTNLAVLSERVSPLAGKIDGLEGKIDTLLKTIATERADPKATPAGRLLTRELDEFARVAQEAHSGFDEGIREVRDETLKNRLWIAAASALVGVAVMVMNLIGPAIIRAMGF